jgi:hypothetical protein
VQPQTLVVGTGRKAKKESVLVLHFSASLNQSAAQNLAAYSLQPGKVKRKVVIYSNKPIPLASAVYDAGAMTVTLVPRGKLTPATMMQLRITSALLTDPLGHTLDNGQNYVVTLGRSGVTIMRDDLVVAPPHRAAPASVLHRISATRSVPHGPAGL